MKITLTELDLEKTAGRLTKLGKGRVWGAVKQWWKGSKPGKGFGGQLGKATTKGLAYGLGGLGIGAGAAAAGAAGSAVHRKLTSKRRFEAMMQHYPGLKKHRTAQVKKRWDTLNKFSPALAKDPLIAGTFLKRTMELGGDIDIKTIGEIAKARKDLAAAGSAGVGGVAMQSMIKGFGAKD